MLRPKRTYKASTFSHGHIPQGTTYAIFSIENLVLNVSFCMLNIRRSSERLIFNILNVIFLFIGVAPVYSECIFCVYGIKQISGHNTARCTQMPVIILFGYL